jgi:hypothetical protein
MPEKTLFDKVMEIDPIFAKEVTTMTADGLKNELYKMAKHRVEIDEAKSNDMDLKSAQDHVKELNETYAEPLKAIKLKSKLAVQYLKSLNGAK